MNSLNCKFSFAIAIGFVLSMPLAPAAPGDIEEPLLWSLPTTEPVAKAFKRVQDEKKWELHEILSGNGFGIGRDAISLKIDGIGKWRFEYFTGHTNAMVFMGFLLDLQRGDRGSVGIWKSEEQIYSELIDHIADPTVTSEVERNRRYEKKLKFFNEYWEDVGFHALPLPGRDGSEAGSASPENHGESRIQGAEQGTGQPATLPESKPEGGDKPQPEAEGN